MYLLYLYCPSYCKLKQIFLIITKMHSNDSGLIESVKDIYCISCIQDQYGTIENYPKPNFFFRHVDA